MTYRRKSSQNSPNCRGAVVSGSIRYHTWEAFFSLNKAWAFLANVCVVIGIGAWDIRFRVHDTACQWGKFVLIWQDGTLYQYICSASRMSARWFVNQVWTWNLVFLRDRVGIEVSCNVAVANTVMLCTTSAAVRLYRKWWQSIAIL
jgi:hypothetical protein